MVRSIPNCEIARAVSRWGLIELATALGVFVHGQASDAPNAFSTLGIDSSPLLFRFRPYIQSRY
jgi:hypothetical protein